MLSLMKNSLFIQLEGVATEEQEEGVRLVVLVALVAFEFLCQQTSTKDIAGQSARLVDAL